MAILEVTLLDAVSAVGFGSIIQVSASPIRFRGMSIEPSSDAQVDSDQTIGEGIAVQFSYDATFPQPPSGHVRSAVTGPLCIMPHMVENPENDPAPQGVVMLWQPAFQDVQAGSIVLYPYLRAQLLAPLSQGTVTLKFYYETL